MDHQKRCFRPQSSVNAGIDFNRFLNESVKRYEQISIAESKKISDKFFSDNPDLLNMTVKQYFDAPTVTDVLLDYIKGFDMNKSVVGYRPNKGYDFPEDYENKSLVSVIKDFVLYAIHCIVPKNTPKTLKISYAGILRGAMLKMSSREFIMITAVFKKTEALFKLKDVCAKLSIVALYVIFDNYIHDCRKKYKKVS